MVENEIQQLFNNSYTPAFFRMKIDLPVDLTDLNTLTPEVMSLYFHEYIHFVQDVSTIYGLMGISNTTYYVRDAASTIVQSGESRFKVPHKIKKRYGDHGFNNHKVWKYYRGSSINPKHRTIEINSNPKIKSVKIDGNELKYVQFRAMDMATGKNFEFQFGGNIVTEGMAYLCEREGFKKAFEANGSIFKVGDDYPYAICEKIVARIFPKLAEYPLLIIALCDISLMGYNPGLLFIELLEHFKTIKLFEEQDGKIKDAVGFITYFYERGYEYIKGRQYDLATMQHVVLHDMKAYFKDKCFEKNNEWLETVFSRVYDYRSKIPQFITDFILLCDDTGIQNNCIFKEFVNKVGSPMVINDNLEATYMPPDGFNYDEFSPSLLWAIHQMYLLFLDSQKKLPCALMEHCKLSKDPNIVVDKNCRNAPWLHASYSGLCPYGAVWKHWGMVGKEPE